MRSRWTGPPPAGTRRGRDARPGCGPSCRAIGPARALRCRSPRQGTRDPRPNLPALQGWGGPDGRAAHAETRIRPRRSPEPDDPFDPGLTDRARVARAGPLVLGRADPTLPCPRLEGQLATLRARPAGSPLGWGGDRDPVHVPRLRRRDGRRGRSGARDPWRPRVRRDRPAARRGRGPRPLVERELQGRPGDDADGKVARINPLIPGIDLAGEVVASSDPAIRARRRRSWPTATTSGSPDTAGYGEYTRVPAGYVVPLPRRPVRARRDGHRDGRVHGGDVRGRARAERPRAGDGPVLVTGASGGVGSVAVAILAARGHEVWAATGKATEEDRLRSLGAVGFVPRDECTARGHPPARVRPLGRRRRHGRRGDAAVRPADPPAGSGGRLVRERRRRRLATTVLPFILRGVSLLGMDSANMAIERAAGALGAPRDGPPARGPR